MLWRRLHAALAKHACPAKPHLQVSCPPGSVAARSVANRWGPHPHPAPRTHLSRAQPIGDGPVPWHKDSNAARFAVIRF
jgi:hypothetical protein